MTETSQLVQVGTVVPEVKQEWEKEAALLRETLFKGANDLEFRLFVAMCRARNLDPLKGQIHGMKFYNSKEKRHDVVIVNGIGGLRAIAARTGEYAGSEDPVFENNRTNPKYPISAKVTVYRMTQGVRCPFTATALWDEFYPGESERGGQYRQRPRHMLAKVAESMAIRKAFPEETGGMYEHAELHRTAAQPEIAKLKSVNEAFGITAPKGDNPLDAIPEEIPDYGAYTVPNGPLKGKSLKELNMSQLEDLRDKVRKFAIEPDAKAEVKEFFHAVDMYLQG